MTPASFPIFAKLWLYFPSSRRPICFCGTISTPVELIDDDLQQLIDDMLETMYAAPGIGLAAIQVGVAKCLLVMDLHEPESDAEDAPAVKLAD